MFRRVSSGRVLPTIKNPYRCNRKTNRFFRTSCLITSFLWVTRRYPFTNIRAFTCFVQYYCSTHPIKLLVDKCINRTDNSLPHWVDIFYWNYVWDAGARVTLKSTTCFVTLIALILFCFRSLFYGVPKNVLTVKQHNCNFRKDQHNFGLVFNVAGINIWQPNNWIRSSEEMFINIASNYRYLKH